MLHLKKALKSAAAGLAEEFLLDRERVAALECVVRNLVLGEVHAQDLKEDSFLFIGEFQN